MHVRCIFVLAFSLVICSLFAVSPGHAQISIGISVDVRGTSEGVPFSGRMTEIVGNHLALVSDGRAGSDSSSPTVPSGR